MFVAVSAFVKNFQQQRGQHGTFKVFADAFEVGFHLTLGDGVTLGRAVELEGADIQRFKVSAELAGHAARAFGCGLNFAEIRRMDGDEQIRFADRLFFEDHSPGAQLAVSLHGLKIGELALYVLLYGGKTADNAEDNGDAQFGGENFAQFEVVVITPEGAVFDLDGFAQKG